MANCLDVVSRGVVNELLFFVSVILSASAKLAWPITAA